MDPLKYQQGLRPSASARRDEAMTVKLRYKAPAGKVSSLVSTTLSTQPTDTPTLRFAAAVAKFGMLLRDSPWKGSASYGDMKRLAEAASGEDRHGHRAEFVRLVETAQRVSRLNRIGQ